MIKPWETAVFQGFLDAHTKYLVLVIDCAFFEMEYCVNVEINILFVFQSVEKNILFYS